MTITITWRQLVAFCVFVLLATLLTWWVEQPAPDAAATPFTDPFGDPFADLLA